MKKYNCIIVEDEELLAGVLKTYLSHFEELELVAICGNPMQANKILKQQTVDLLFLDIEMPQMTGVDFYKSIDNPPAVIFTTAYSEYAIEGFNLSAVDYLLKPIKLDRFLVAVNKFLALKSPTKKVENNTISQPIEKDTISLKSDGNWVRLKYTEIAYVEALREYVRFHTISGERFIVLRSLSGLEAELPEVSFIRIHRSYIVNKNHIVKLVGNQVIVAEARLSLSNSYRTAFRGWFMK